MGEFEVYQRTKDGFFSASKLLNQWNNSTGSEKRVDTFLGRKNAKEFIEAIKSDKDTEENYGTDFQPVTKTGGRKTLTGQEPNDYWMHPLLFIDFAMWLNPRFKLQVLKFVKDQLIEFRHGAGDNYRELSSAVQQFQNPNYPSMAKALNYIVFNTHKKELRQNATEKQLFELQDIQKKLAFAVNTGLITSFDKLLEHMRKMWSNKWNNFE